MQDVFMKIKHHNKEFHKGFEELESYEDKRIREEEPFSLFQFGTYHPRNYKFGKGIKNDKI